MRFLDNLSKSLSSGVDRAKFEADKFQRTTRINGEIANFKSQIDTNMRQLGERALELYQQGTLQAPEIASLAQIIAQLRAQLQAKEQELEAANAETYEQSQPSAPATPPQSTSGQSIPVQREPAEGSFPTPTVGASAVGAPQSTDISGSGMPNPSSVGDVTPGVASAYTCTNCGSSVPAGAGFCPNCGTRVVGR
jgi:hypothetical protein